MEHFFSLILSLVKLPFVALFKTIFTVLNLVPLNVFEIFGARGNSSTERPDLRELHTKIKGKRKAHLGTCIIAWTRGAIFTAHLNSAGLTCKGIYTEDFQDIQKKWNW